MLSNSELALWLPWPSRDANKYTRGKLLLIAGSAKYPGAACLAATAAGRVGAGYVQVCCADESASVLRNWQPSLVVTPWSMGVPLGAKVVSDNPVAFAVGPGFDGRDELCVQIARSVVQGAADTATPLLVDGGALGALSDMQGIELLRAYAEASTPAVLTPHGGEAKRLAAASGVEVFTGQPEGTRYQEDFARRLSAALHAVVVLKGPDTCIAYEGEALGSCGYEASQDAGHTQVQAQNRDLEPKTYVMSEGTPALAKAGTGDILAGMIGGLLAQGIDPLRAAILGTTLHARAGIVAGERMTDIAVLPEDVLSLIPLAIQNLASSREGL